MSIRLNISDLNFVFPLITSLKICKGRDVLLLYLTRPINIVVLMLLNPSHKIYKRNEPIVFAFDPTFIEYKYNDISFAKTLYQKTRE